MSASLVDIRPVVNGVYRVITRNRPDGRTKALAVFPHSGNAVGLSSDSDTTWLFEYVHEHGSYRIWNHGTKDVLDATRFINANTLTSPHIGQDWQQWAVRLQIDGTRPENPGRVIGYTLTPLSQPAGALTMAEHDPDALFPPAQVREAPSAGGKLDNRQLWLLHLQPSEQQLQEPDAEMSYTEEAKAQIAQYKEQLAARAESEASGGT